MKHLTRLAICMVLVILAAPVAGDVVSQNEAEVRVVAEPILDNLLAGFNEGSYVKYARDFDETLKEALPEKKFTAVRQDIMKKMGKYQAKTYLGSLKQAPYSVVLWKGKFADTDKDVLIKLVLSKRQDRVVVTGLWFQ